MADAILQQEAEKKLGKYFLGRQEAYKDSPGQRPVVVLTEINTADDVDKAIFLWESNSSTYMKVMFMQTQGSTLTSKYQLIIYEIPTKIHESVIEFFAKSINAGIYSLDCDDLIEAIGTADCKRSDGQSTMQADKAYERPNGPGTDDTQLTFVIEVGWTQHLGPGTLQTSLLGKTKDWIAPGVSLVLAVKLYVYKGNQRPGMLVFMVTGDNRVVRVIQTGEYHLVRWSS